MLTRDLSYHERNQTSFRTFPFVFVHIFFFLDSRFDFHSCYTSLRDTQLRGNFSLTKRCFLERNFNCRKKKCLTRFLSQPMALQLMWLMCSATVLDAFENNAKKSKQNGSRRISEKYKISTVNTCSSEPEIRFILANSGNDRF